MFGWGSDDDEPREATQAEVEKAIAQMEDESRE